MRQRIVFLDIDGVLNNAATMQAPFTMDPLNVQPLMQLFDEIEDLAIGAEPKLVISSSWRHGPEASWDWNIRQAFANAGWADPPIIARTPDLGDDGPSGTTSAGPDGPSQNAEVVTPGGRGAEIRAWLHDNFGEDFTEHVVFAIVDDDIHDMLDEQLPFVVKCDSETGLTAKEIQTLKEILGNFSQSEWFEAIDAVRGLDNVWVIDRSAEPEEIEQQVDEVIDGIRKSLEEDDDG